MHLFSRHQTAFELVGTKRRVDLYLVSIGFNYQPLAILIFKNTTTRYPPVIRFSGQQDWPSRETSVESLSSHPPSLEFQRRYPD